MQKDTFKLAIQTFGIKRQLIKLVEEMSELTKEITKMLGPDNISSNPAFLEEIADVHIVLEQIKLKYPKWKGHVQNKVIRLANTIRDYK